VSLVGPLDPMAGRLHAGPMVDPAKRRATYEDLCAVPEHIVAEIINGDLVTHPRPSAPHALAHAALGSDIFGPFHRGKGGPGGWVILFEPELHLDGHVLVPDMAGWRRQRMPTVPDVAAISLVPDWICESLSPRTAATDRADKMPIYGGLGVSHVWLVDPQTCTLEVYRLEALRYLLLGTWRDDAIVRADPFSAIEIELGVLWAK
jgi:Uma2 family endonuclease